MELNHFEVKEGDIVVVLGAHEGKATTFYSEKVGPTGKVIAIEPELENFQHLRNSTSLLNNVLIKNVAIGQRTRLGYLNLGSHGGAHSTVRSFGGESQMVLICAWNMLMRMFGLERVDLVKVDVEGAEVQWLRGMSKALPKHIVMEEHSRFAYAFDELADLLRQRGYKWIKEGYHVYATR